MDGAEPRSSEGQGLGWWIAGPLLALGLVVVLVGYVPSPDCNGFGRERPDSQEVLLMIVTAIVSLAAIGGAIRHWMPLVRREGAWLSIGVVILGIGVLAILTALNRHGGGAFAAVFLIAVAATLAALVALLVAWGRGRRAGEVGPLLSIYLFGAGAFCLPGITVISLSLKSGALC